MTKLWPLAAFLIIFSSIALAEVTGQISTAAEPDSIASISLDISGTCKEFNVTLTASNFSEGCYDVKIDITTPSGRVGRIYDTKEGWKSSIYYIDEALCIGANESVVSEVFQMKAETSAKQLYFQPRLRAGSKTWESSHVSFEQDCPVESDNEILFLVSLIVILTLLVVITMYVKVWKK